MEILSMCVNIIAHDHTAGNQIINPATAPGIVESFAMIDGGTKE
ncbi:hypothetical protein [Escherichia coli]